MQRSVLARDVHPARRNAHHAQRVAIDVGIVFGDDVARSLHETAIPFATFTGPIIFLDVIDVITRDRCRVIVDDPPRGRIGGRIDDGIRGTGKNDKEVFGAGKRVRPFVEVVGRDIHHHRDFRTPGRDGHGPGQHTLIIGPRSGRVRPRSGPDFIGNGHVLGIGRAQTQDEGHRIGSTLPPRSLGHVGVVAADVRQRGIVRILAVGRLFDDADRHVQRDRDGGLHIRRRQHFSGRLLQGETDRSGREAAIHQALRRKLIDDDETAAALVAATAAGARTGRRGFGHLRRVNAGRNLGLQGRHALLLAFRLQGRRREDVLIQGRRGITPQIETSSVIEFDQHRPRGGGHDHVVHKDLVADLQGTDDPVAACCGDNADDALDGPDRLNLGARFERLNDAFIGHDNPPAEKRMS